MCGIAGVIAPGEGFRSTAAAHDVQEMIKRIAHRGPDELRYWNDSRAALATARLSIIDVLHGQQPMCDPDRRYWIAYNGEVYNYVELREQLRQRGHVFRTESDTEVVLRAWMEWGEEAPARFDGGFAIAIYDKVADTTVLIRDRAGKRPLFYTRHRGALAFASEMKCFLALEGFAFSWDAGDLSGIATVWTPVGAQTGFKDIRQLPSGTILTVSPQGERQTTYASLPPPSAAKSAEPPDAEGRVRELLADSTRLRLRSDVEVALFLSGGLDSAIVARLARNLSPRIRTYSVQFDDENFDERADQNIVADYLELENRTIKVGPGSIADVFADAVWHAEVPQFRTAFVPMYLLAQRVREDSIKVVLSGEGADEVFLGYDIFKETLLRANWGAMNAQERKARLQRLYPYVRHFTEENAAAIAALFARASREPAGAFFSHQIRFENSSLATRLLTEQGEPLAAMNGLVSQAPGFPGMSPVRRAQWLEFYSLLQGYLLSTQSDRMLFAHGVEPRCPFLSWNVIEYTMSLPETSLLSGDLREKDILKRAFRDVLPPRMLDKPKWPYRAPDVASFFEEPRAGGRLLEWVREALSPQRLGAGPLNGDMVGRLVGKIEATPPDKISPRENQAFIFALSVALLHEQFVGRKGAPRPGRAPTEPVFATAGGA